MEYEGMVHALEEVHRLLKPTGVLIDVHPVAEPSPMEIHRAGRIDVAGHVSVRQWRMDFEEADHALAETLRRGLFVLERQSVSDSLTHYGSAAEMLASLKESLDKFARDAQSAGEDVPHIESLAAQAEERMRMAGSGAELIIREPTHFARLRPI